MYEYRAKIIKIIDGDTVDVDIDLGFDVILSNQRVRLHGIDTPESRTRDREEKKFGLLSKKFLTSFLPKGSTQTLMTIVDRDGDDTRGKFGRILGKFKVYDAKRDQETTINELMIREGYAVAYHGQNKELVQEQHMKNREILREQGLVK